MTSDIEKIKKEIAELEKRLEALYRMLQISKRKK